MKPGVPNRTSKQPISVIQRKLWEHCRRIIRARYPHNCYTCPRTGIEGKDFHTGHLWAKASLGASLKYDLRVLRPQCYNCNINLGGMGAIFYVNMLKEIGRNKMAELERDRVQDRRGLLKAYDHYVTLLAEYATL